MLDFTRAFRLSACQDGRRSFSKVPEIPGEDHAEFREQFVHKHPDVLLPPHREPHRKLVERIQRDYLVHGAVMFTGG